MKIQLKSVLIIVMVLLVFNSYSQIILPKEKEVQRIKNSKLIVATINHEDYEDKETIENYNAMMKKIVENYWTFSDISNIEYMPLKQALQKAKSGNYSVLNIGTSSSSGAKTRMGNYNVTYITTGLHIEVYSPKSVIRMYLPQFDDGISDEIVVYGIMKIQYTMRKVESGGKIPLLKFQKVLIFPFGKELKNKKMLIPKEWCTLETNEIKEYYKSDFELVDYSVVKKAIIEKQKDVAIVYIVPVPSGSTYTYMQYVFDPETGKIFALSYDMVSVGIKGGPDTSERMAYLVKKSFKKYQKQAESK